jgi:hypothetical protein
MSNRHLELDHEISPDPFLALIERAEGVRIMELARRKSD